jgi:hypothetical protein
MSYAFPAVFPCLRRVLSVPLSIRAGPAVPADLALSVSGPVGDGITVEIASKPPGVPRLRASSCVSEPADFVLE